MQRLRGGWRRWIIRVQARRKTVRTAQSVLTQEPELVDRAALRGLQFMQPSVWVGGGTADAADLKSAGATRVGSRPTRPTTAFHRLLTASTQKRRATSVMARRFCTGYLGQVMPELGAQNGRQKDYGVAARCAGLITGRQPRGSSGAIPSSTANDWSAVSSA